MRFRNLDENSDWELGKGKNSYAFDSASLELNIKTRLLSWLGDCFFAQDEGIDWVNRIGSKNQRELLEEDLRRMIIQTEEVIELLSFSTILEGRDFTASYTVSTIYTEDLTASITRTV